MFYYLFQDADDVIMDSITPTLFVIGEHAQTCPIADLENMREKMRAKNHLVVVAGANDHLNVNFKTKKEHSLTQSVVDRCILVRCFLLYQLPFVSLQTPNLYFLLSTCYTG